MTAKRNRIRFGKFFRLRPRLRPREAGKSGRRFFIFSAMLPVCRPERTGRQRAERRSRFRPCFHGGPAVAGRRETCSGGGLFPGGKSALPQR